MGEAKRRREQFHNNPRPCVFCGAPDATTMDHVPPKGIFTRPRPKLITVPACETCNGGASQFDEEFKIFLSLRVGMRSAAAQEFWTRGGMPSIRHNRRMLRTLLTSPTVMVPNDQGEPTAVIAYRWDAENHSSTIEKITRGLIGTSSGCLCLRTPE